MFGRLLTLILAIPLVMAAMPADVAAPLHLAPLKASAPLPLAMAPDVPSVLDSQSPPVIIVSTGAEPQMLADKNGVWLWIGDTAGVHRSKTGGASWSHGIPTHIGGLFNDGVALAQDDTGRLYATSTNGQIIYVDSSTNGGVTWTANLLVAAAPIADRPWLDARGNGEVVLLYYGAPGGEMCARSTDAGATWLTRSIAWQTPNAGNVEFDAAGRFYYVEDSRIHQFGSNCVQMSFMDQAPVGAQILTQLTVAENVGPTPDIFVAAPSNGNGAMQIRGYHGMLKPSEKILAVNPASYKSNTFGAIAAKEDGSEIAVVWYGSTTPGDPSTATYPASATWDVLLSRVTGFWTATPTITTTLIQSGNHVGGFCMNGVGCTTGDRDLLDYQGIAYGPDGKIHMSFGHDGATANQEVRYASVP